MSVRGSRTGVFIGVSTNEAMEAWAADLEAANGYEMTGCSRAMLANRLSFYFDFKGIAILPQSPSFFVFVTFVFFDKYAIFCSCHCIRS